MRFRIEAPCFIETESPFTVIPIYQKAEPVVVETPVVTPVKRINYPATRASHPRVNRTCMYCGRTFRGIARQLYCSTTHKHLFYSNGRKPMGEGLAIHAGATGVQVKGAASGAGY